MDEALYVPVDFPATLIALRVLGPVLLTRLLDRCILDPVPNFGPEVTLVQVRQELDAFERIDLRLLMLV